MTATLEATTDATEAPTKIETAPVWVRHNGRDRFLDTEKLERCYEATLAWVNDLLAYYVREPVERLLPTTCPNNIGECCIANTLESRGLRSLVQFSDIWTYDGRRELSAECPEEVQLFQKALILGGYPSLATRADIERELRGLSNA